MEEQRHRTFGYIRIVWEIENCFCVAYRNNWRICSQEFSVNGFLPIKWRFVLRGTKTNDNNEYTAWLDLERLDNNNTPPVQVFWNVSFLFPGRSIGVRGRDGFFYAKGCMSSRIEDFRRVLEIMQNVSTDKINIESLFLVNSTVESASLKRSHDSGLCYLTENLADIYKKDDYSDLTIHVNMAPNSVRKHKAILATGNGMLSNFSEVCSNLDIILDSLDMESAEKIFRYLYTGNLGYVLGMPSILIDQAIKYLGVKELEKYYTKDELILRTKFKATELYYKWEVTDISSHENGLILSPSFGTRDFNLTFRFRLKMSDIYAPTGNVILFLEASACPRQFQEIYIMFEIVDIFGNSLNRKRSGRWSLEVGGVLELKNFLTADDLSPLATAGNELHGLGIVCKIFIPTDELTPLGVSKRTCLLPFLDYEEHFRLLSKRIESLFLTRVYSDLTISCGDDQFHVHKRILSARSPYFAALIRLPMFSSGFYITDIDIRILRIVLVYIYSGVLKNDELSDVSEIYRAAAKFHMLFLRNQCTKILEERLVLSNALDTLYLADDCEDWKLKSSAFKFILYNRYEIDQVKLMELVQKERLYEEFKDYIRKFVRHNPDEGKRLLQK